MKHRLLLSGLCLLSTRPGHHTCAWRRYLVSGHSFRKLRFDWQRPIAVIPLAGKTAVVNIPIRLISLGACALVLAGCFFVGYMNGILKGAVDDASRALLLIGFIIGAGATARYLRQRGLEWLLAHRERRRRSRTVRQS